MVFEPKGLRFYDKNYGQMLLVQDVESSYHHWLCRRHAAGQWVTLRKATEDDLARLGVTVESEVGK